MSNVLVRDTVRMEALVSPGMWVWVWEEVASRDIGSMAVLQRHPAHESLVKRGARELALGYFSAVAFVYCCFCIVLTLGLHLSGGRDLTAAMTAGPGLVMCVCVYVCVPRPASPEEH